MRPGFCLCLAAYCRCCAVPHQQPHAVLPLRRSRACIFTGGTIASRRSRRSCKAAMSIWCSMAIRSRRITNSSGPPEWRDFHAGMATLLWRSACGESRLQRRCDVASAVAHRERRGRGIEPKVAVILIGANNLGRLHWSAEDSVAGIDAIVVQLRHRLPHTKLMLLGVLPADRSAWATETTLAINQHAGGTLRTWR